MTVTVEIPDAVAASMLPEGVDPARKLLEDAMAQAYRDGRIGTATLRDVLNLSWWEKEAFLLQHGIYNDLSAAEVLADAEAAKQVREKHRAELASA